MFDLDGDGAHPVVLDGGASSDDEGGLAWQWMLGAREIASGAGARVDLPLGEHVITLLVTDARGLTDTDQVTVRVAPPPRSS